MSWRGLGLVALTALAYNYSLLSLGLGLVRQTPVSDLVLVAGMALVLGAVRVAAEPHLRPIHDRQLDWIVGLTLIGVAATVALLAPSTYSGGFWLQRLDLLGIPFFVAGAVALLYGVRRLWSLRFPVAFLFFLWPVPYALVAGAVSRLSSWAADAGVDLLSRLVPLTRPAGQAGALLVTSGGQPLSLSVETAGTGAGAVVALLLVGIATTGIVRGRALPRLAWIACGVVAVLLLNVARIEVVFAAAALLGERAAIDVVDPVAGLVALGAGIAAMLLALGPFGLELVQPSAARSGAPSDGRATIDPVPRRGAPLAVLLGAALVLGVANSGYARFSRIVDEFGQPRLDGIDLASLHVDGWTKGSLTTYGQATWFFGSASSWQRVALAPAAGGATSSDPVYLDVITTDDDGTLASHDVESSYNFRDFRAETRAPLDIGAGVDAQVGTFLSPTGGAGWSVLWWEWPCAAPGGTRFQRIVLLAQDGSGPALASTGNGPAGVPDPPPPDTRALLTSLARSVAADGLQAGLLGGGP